MTHRSFLRALLSPATLAAAVVLSAGVANPVRAESTDDDIADDLEFALDTVVVTATRTERDLAEAPASVSVVTNEELLKVPVGDLTDAIRTTPGISINAGSQGRRSISIRGMDSAYTLILIDGKRVNSRESVFRHNDFDLSQIPVEAIERIEVVRGSMSSLYGADALGGVINIITKKIPDAWKAGIDLKGQMPTSGTGGQEGRASVYAAGPLVKDRLSLRVTGSLDGRRIWHGSETPDARVMKNEETPILRPDGSEVYERDLATLEGRADHGGRARLVWTPDERQTVSAEYGLGYQTRRGEYFINGSYGDADSELHRNDAIVAHEGKWGWGQTTARAYWERTDTTTDDNVQNNLVVEGNATLGFQALGSHVLTVGADAKWTGLEAPGTFTSGHASAHQEAIYAQNEWELLPSVTLLGGARLDYHGNFGLHATPRGYVVLTPTKGLTIKGGVGTGFRAPTLRQMSDESITPSCRGACVIAGNPVLAPETAINYELSAGWTERAYGLTAGVFLNDVANLIDTPRGAGVDPVGHNDAGLPIFTPRNVKRARMSGVEAEAYYRYRDHVKVSANYTLLDATDLDEDKPLDNRPRHSVNAQVDWNILSSLGLFTRAQYLGEQHSGTELIPGYALFDAGLSWKALDNLGVTGGVLNIANTRTTSEDGYSYQERGRTVYLGVNGHI